MTTKVKGNGFIPINKTIDPHLMKSDLNYIEELLAINPYYEYKILDTADYVIPPNDYNSVFIMTNFIRTKQNRHKCENKNETSEKMINWCPLENDSNK